MTLLSAVSLLPIAMACAFGLRRALHAEPGERLGLRRAVAAVALLVAAVVAGMLAIRVMAPPPDIVSQTVGIGDALVVPPTTSPIIVVAEVEFPDHGVSADGGYVLDVENGAQRIVGHAEQHFERRRVGRRGHTKVLVAHVGHHHDVDVDASAGLHVTLAEVSGQLSQSVVLRARPAPPALPVVVAILAAAGVVVAGTQRRRGRDTFVKVTGAAFAMLAYALMIETASGEPAMMWVLVFTPLALLGGGLVAVAAAKALGVHTKRSLR